jgi:peroxiredoxin
MRAPALLLFAICCNASAVARDYPVSYLKYLSAIKEIEIAGYDLVRKDIFVSGNTWDHSGTCVIKRGSNRIDFFGQRSNYREVFIGLDGQLFIIDHAAKTYKQEPLLDQSLLSSPGGQMVIPELLTSDSIFFEIEEIDGPEDLILKMYYRDSPQDGITDHYKLIYLSRTDYLPTRIDIYLKVFGKQQVTKKFISNLKINDVSLESHFDTGTIVKQYNETLSDSRSEVKSLRAGSIIPSFTLQGMDGNLYELSVFRGNVALLDFWDIWCGPCIQSLDKVQEIHERYNSSGLTVLGILVDEKNRNQAVNILTRKSITFLNLLGTPDVRSYFGLNEIPRYLLIDKNGKVLQSITSVSKLEESLPDLLANKGKQKKN